MLRIKVGALDFTARWEEAAAPRTCAAVLTGGSPMLTNALLSRLLASRLVPREAKLAAIELPHLDPFGRGNVDSRVDTNPTGLPRSNRLATHGNGLEGRTYLS